MTQKIHVKVNLGPLVKWLLKYSTLHQNQNVSMEFSVSPSH